MYYVYPDELYHYGIKGMKWGVRRYQNKDGTYTAAGKKRYNEEDLVEYKYNKPGESGWIGMGRAIKANVSKAGNTAKNKVSNSKKNRYDNSAYSEAKKMSDSELQNAINRLRLEGTYRELKTKDIMAGKAASRGVLAEFGFNVMNDSVRNIETDLSRRASNAVINKMAKKRSKKTKMKKNYTGPYIV